MRMWSRAGAALLAFSSAMLGRDRSRFPGAGDRPRGRQNAGKTRKKGASPDTSVKRMVWGLRTCEENDV